jgi:bacterioferritin (cytochrome b1)
MADSTATKNQVEFIRKLREDGVDREAKVREYLSNKGKEDVKDLSMQEASELIDSLKKIKGPDSDKKEVLATGKQITFITNLQDTEERKNLIKSYLSEKKKESINSLSMTEASSLIDRLMQLKGGPRTSSADNLATKKQIQFIKNLQDTDSKLKFALSYLKDLKKMSVEELTKKEASTLIEKLKDIKK